MWTILVSHHHHHKYIFGILILINFIVSKPTTRAAPPIRPANPPAPMRPVNPPQRPIAPPSPQPPRSTNESHVKSMQNNDLINSTLDAHADLLNIGSLNEPPPKVAKEASFDLLGGFDTAEPQQLPDILSIN